MCKWLFRAFALCLFVGVVGLIGYRILHKPDQSIPTPFSDSANKPPLSSLTNKSYLVYGFVPYWNLPKTVIQPELTHFAYFSLPITVDGDLDGITTERRSTSTVRWESERLENAINQLSTNQKLTITLTQFDNNTIATFLSTPSAQTRFQNSLVTLLDSTSRPIDGFNLDIESSGESSPVLRQKYTELVQKTRQTLDTYAQQKGRPPLQLSISLYASAAKRPLLWDIPALTPHVDQMVVMAYDFHRSSSPVAGPVAPVFGGKKNWDSDIVVHLKEFLEVVPPEKILLGIPFYGYEWQTTSEDPRSPVFPGTGSTASYGRVQKLLEQSEELGIQQGWDEDALSPYLVFTRNGRTHIIYYENSRSLGYKLDLVTGLRLGGVAIWALGYEDGSREPWEMMRIKLSE